MNQHQMTFRSVSDNHSLGELIRGRPLIIFSILIILMTLIGPYSLAKTAGSKNIKSFSKMMAVCEIQEEGPTNAGWKKVRLAKMEPGKQDIIQGFDSLDEAVKTMKDASTKGECLLKSQSCEFEGEGYAMGSWYRSILVVKEAAISGANDIGTLISQYNQLRSAGICQ